MVNTKEIIRNEAKARWATIVYILFITTLVVYITNK